MYNLITTLIFHSVSNKRLTSGDKEQYKCVSPNYCNETIYRDNPEYQKAQKELNKKTEQLEARLNQEEKQMLEEVEDAFYKTQEDIEKIAYMAGFRLGMRLAIAALTETSD